MHAKFTSNGVYIFTQTHHKNIATLIHKAPRGVSKGNFALAGSVIQAERVGTTSFIQSWPPLINYINMRTKAV